MRLRVVVVKNQEGISKLPKWLRSVLVDTDTDTVFVPVGGFTDEKIAMLCLSYDGTEGVMFRDHLFVPAEWAAAEFEEGADLVSMMVERARESVNMRPKGLNPAGE